MKIALVLIMMALANTFMLTAWYWHLRPGSAEGRPLILIILSSWLIALLEYSIMVPANRLGASAHMSVAQLRVAAEAVSLLVFIPFSVYFMHERFRLDTLWAFLCILGAVYFVNRSSF